MSFDGKVAMVAGAGGGMGLNIANDLIAAGCRAQKLDPSCYAARSYT